jgi:hypothetical protein
MGTFAETTVVDYRLLFADQENKLPFFVSVYSRQTEVAIFVSSVCWIYSINIFQMGNGKQKPRRFSLIRLPFSHHANGSLSFLRLLTKEQREVIRLQMD